MEVFCFQSLCKTLKWNSVPGQRKPMAVQTSKDHPSCAAHLEEHVLESCLKILWKNLIYPRIVKTLFHTCSHRNGLPPTYVLPPMNVPLIDFYICVYLLWDLLCYWESKITISVRVLALWSYFTYLPYIWKSNYLDYFKFQYPN